MLSIVLVALALAGTGLYAEFGGSASRVVFLIAGWLLGDSIGSRRAYVHEIEEKAARLERERETVAGRVVAEEQARIARELHDVVAHALSVIVVQAGAARGGLRSRPEPRPGRRSARSTRRREARSPTCAACSGSSTRTPPMSRSRVSRDSTG